MAYIIYATTDCISYFWFEKNICLLLDYVMNGFKEEVE
jgi:hypothetical protein